MIFNNKVEILKLGLLPMVIYAMAMEYLSNILPGGLNELQVGYEGTGANFPFFEIFLALMALAVAILSFAVNWHRYVLIEERPQSWMVSFNMDRIGAYFLAGLKISLIMLIFLIFSVVLSSSIKLIGLLNVTLILYVLTFFVSVYVTQLSIILPAAAIGKPIGLLTASEHMKGSFWAVFTMVVLLWLANVLIFGIVTLLNNSLLVTTATCFQFLAQVFMAMLNVSILTTLYGYYVEGREI